MMKLRTKVSANRRWNRRGAAAVECACVSPVVILIVLGGIDAGQSINVAQIVNDASREGARRASRITLANESEVESAVQSYFVEAFPGVPASELNEALTVDVRDSSGATIPGGDLTTIPSGSSVSVQVILQYEAVRWTVGFPGLNGKSIQTTTVMRRD